MKRGCTAAVALAFVLITGCTSAVSPPNSPTSRPSSKSIETLTLPADPGGSSRRAPSEAKTTAPGVRTASILGSGDVLIHPPLWEQARADARAAGRDGYDFAPMYASIAPDTRAADLATCELETPLAEPQGPFQGWPSFSAPPQVLTALKGVGYDSCTTASNHSLDQGYGGVKRTLDELDAAGLRHTGSARTAREAATALIVTLPNGVRIGQLAYAFGFNGNAVPAGKPWLANEIDVPRILAAAKRMKTAGADIVVVSMHWGVEYDHLASGEQRAQASRLLASPYVDLILGDHAHVVQPADRVNGKWVFYCMGDQVSWHADPIAANREGVMPLVTFRETSPHHFRVSSAAAIATWMADSPAKRLIDLPRALASSDLTTAQRTQYTRARAQIASALDAYHARRDGLVIR